MKILPSPKKPAVQLASDSVDMYMLLWRWLVCWSSGRRTRRGLMKTSSRWGRYKEPVMSVLTRCSLHTRLADQLTRYQIVRSSWLVDNFGLDSSAMPYVCIRAQNISTETLTCPLKVAKILCKIFTDEKIVHLIHRCVFNNILLISI